MLYKGVSGRWWDTGLRDVRVSLRAFGRNPGFALATIVTLALGIGANSAIFSVVHAALLQPLPYDNPDQLYSVEVVIPERRDEMPSLPVRVQDYLEWNRAETAFSAVAALTPGRVESHRRRRTAARRRRARVDELLRRARRAAGPRPHVPAPTKSSPAAIAS